MNAILTDDHEDKLNALRSERARQDELLAKAFEALRACPDRPVAVSAVALRALDSACLIPTAFVATAALRG